ncbi:MAG: substrate-binding domain-containing protein [Verrucomicrobia bacterium]|jgi:LacI family transcriptional regulator|nr:substrate-binding domain-containing protein [Verrucomicrobiota bacterium]MBT7065108.1 substrate-binding domain-containing protein [Verrucomicrobiota bacterium]
MCYSGNIPHGWEGEGIITTLSGEPVEMASFLKHAGCPAVSLNPNYPQIEVPRVSVDMEAIGRMAAKHFLDRGFRSFAVYTPHSWFTTELSHTAFTHAVEAAGHAVHRLCWLQERGSTPDTWLNRQQWLCHKLNELPMPVAFFSPEADSLAEFMEACSRESISIPDEVATLGLHDSPIFRNCVTVPLSSIAVDYDIQARLCCDLLARMMTGEPAPSKDFLIPPSGIVTRRSSDTIAAQTPAVSRAIRFMLGHFAEAITVDDAVRASGMCRTRLFRAFRQDVEMTPRAVLNRIRLDKAKRMLLETDEKLRTVAEACGFGDPMNLHRHFKRSLNMSPGAYREQAAHADGEQGGA